MTKQFKLICKSNELQLNGTLNGGQSFRWKKKINDEKEKWVGVFYNKVWELQQEDDCILYSVWEPQTEKNLKESHYNQILSNYFQLDLNLKEYYSAWSKKDPFFKDAAAQFYGIRILKQDPVENIFSFICSSNNNIARITSMVEKLASFYGTEICKINGETFYSFPDINSLAGESVEDKLRKNGFGYRARYISKSAQMIMECGAENWIKNLERMKYNEAKKALMLLNGVGAKVADCICLMSLNHLQAVPVDTHVYQIAKRFYMPKLGNNKTVTENVYNEIGNHFRQLYGPLAGWAHTVLFCADLKKFQENNTSTKKQPDKWKKQKK